MDGGLLLGRGLGFDRRHHGDDLRLDRHGCGFGWLHHDPRGLGFGPIRLPLAENSLVRILSVFASRSKGDRRGLLENGLADAGMRRLGNHLDVQRSSGAQLEIAPNLLPLGSLVGVAHRHSRANARSVVVDAHVQQEERAGGEVGLVGAVGIRRVGRGDRDLEAGGVGDLLRRQDRAEGARRRRRAGLAARVLGVGDRGGGQQQGAGQGDDGGQPPGAGTHVGIPLEAVRQGEARPRRPS